MNKNINKKNVLPFYNLNRQNKIYVHECEKCKAKTIYRKVIRGLSTAIIIAAYSCQTSILNPQIVYAQINAHDHASSRQTPIMDKARNGVPIVDIAPPNTHGISHNLYKDFNVNTDGLILNNSANDIETKLAGWIVGNPQLGHIPAEIILNEVISTNQSYLNGYIEVGGKQADLIIANPNGITCNGCGFINTNRASLIVGKPEYSNNDMLESFQTGHGLLSIGEKGLNAQNVAQLDLIARSMQMNGEVWANKLNTVLGSNRVYYKSLLASPHSKTANSPLFALDIKSMGGMYARQVYIVATEKGLGVNSDGRIVALKGNLTLSVNGDLKINEIFAKKDINLRSQGNLSLLGKILSEGNANFLIDNSFYQNGRVDTNGLLQIQTKNMHNNGTLVQSGQGNLLIASKELFHNTGEIFSTGNLQINAQNIVDKRGKISSHEGLSIESNATHLTNTRIESKENITIHSKIIEGKYFDIYSNKNINITNNDKLSSYYGNIYSNENVVIDSKKLETNYSNISAKDNLNIDTKDLSIRNSDLKAKNKIAINANNLNGYNANISSSYLDINLDKGPLTNIFGSLNGEKSLLIHSGEINNKGGFITTNGFLKLDLNNNKLDNSKGLLQVNGELQIKNSEIQNESGRILSATSITIDSEQVNNTLGEIVVNNTKKPAEGFINFTAKNSQINNTKGRIATTGDTTLNAIFLDNTEGIVAGKNTSVLLGEGKLINSKGEFQGENSIELQMGSFDNSQGKLYSKNNMTIDSKTSDLNNAGGILESIGKFTINSAAIDNSNGSILSQDSIIINSQEINNTSGEIIAKKKDESASGNVIINTNSKNLNNTSGKIIAANESSISAHTINNTEGNILGTNTEIILTENGQLFNTQGKIGAIDNAKIQSGRTENKLGNIYANNLLIDTQGKLLNNEEGKIHTFETLNITSADLNNKSGTIYSDDRLSIQSQLLNNSQGKIKTSGESTIKANSITNTEGSIAANNNILLILNNGIINDKGEIFANENIKIEGNITNNQQGLVAAKNNIFINSNNDLVNNNNGSLHSAGKIDIKTNKLLNNSGNTISNNGLNVEAHSFENNSGTIESGENIFISAKSIENNSGKIKNNHLLNIEFSSFKNNDGILYASEINLLLSKENSLENSKGQIAAEKLLNIAAGIANNEGGIIASGNKTIVDSQGEIVQNKHGIILSHGSLAIISNDLNNENGSILSDKNLNIKSSEIDNSSGKIITNSDSEISAKSIKNIEGMIFSQKQKISLQDIGELNNSNGKIVSEKSFALNNGKINNTNGLIATKGDIELDILKNTLINENGSLDAQNSINIKSGTINNNKGAILSGHSLFIDSNDLNNSSGAIIVENSSTSPKANFILNTNNYNLDNKFGTIISQVDTQIHTNSLINENGSIFSDKIDLTGKSINNKNGTIYSDSFLNIHANHLDNKKGDIFAKNDLLATIEKDIINNSGKIRSSSHTKVNAQTIDNSSGGSFASLGNLNIDANLLNNSHGDLSSGNNSYLNFKTLNNCNGTLYSQNSLLLNSTSIDNNSGQIIANGDVHVGTSSSSLGGSIKSNKNIKLNIDSSYTNNSFISARNNLTMTAPRFTNGHKMIAGNELLIHSRGATILNSGSELISNSTQINSSGYLENNGKIDGIGVFIRSRDIENNSRISGHNITLDTNNFNNINRGYIVGASSSGNLQINANKIENKDGSQILSLGNIIFKGNTLNNISSKIVANGNIDFNVVNVTNKKERFEVEQYQTIEKGLKVRLFNHGDIIGITAKDKETTEKKSLNDRIKVDSPIGEILASGNMSFSGNILNDKSKIAAAGTIQYNNARLTQHVFEGKKLVVEEKGQYIFYHRKKKDFFDMLFGGFQSGHDTWETTEPFVLSGEVDETYMLADASVTSRSAVGTLSGISNISVPATGSYVPAPNISSPGKPSLPSDILTKKKQAQLHDIKNPLEHDLPINQSKKENPSLSSLEHLNENSGEKDSLNEQMQKDKLFITDSSDKFAKKDNFKISVPDLYSIPQASAYPILLQLNIPSSEKFKIEQKNEPSYTHETDPDYINHKPFIISNYYYKHMQVNPERQIKNYGDSFDAQRSIADNALATTGRKYLSSYAEAEKEFKSLMNAKAMIDKDFQIAPGTRISNEQMAILTSNLVTNVDNKTNDVKVYLKNLHKNNLNSKGGLLAFGNMNLRVTGDLNNEGTFLTENGLLEAKNINNNEGVIAGKNMQLTAQEDIKNISGRINGLGEGSNVFLKAGRDIVMETKVLDRNLYIGGKKQKDSYLGNIATVQGGNIRFEAGRDIKKIGLNVNASGDFIQIAKRNIESRAAVTEKDININMGNGAFSSEKSTTHNVGKEVSGKKTVIIANEKVDYKGTDIFSVTESFIQGKDVFIAKDKNKMQTKTHLGNNYIEKYDETLSGGKIESRGNIIIRATGEKDSPIGWNDQSGNITLQGSEVKSEHGDIIFEAKKNINILAETTQHNSYEWNKETADNVFSHKTTTKESSSSALNVEKSSLSGNNIYLKAGDKNKKIGDVNLEGSGLVASKNVFISAGNDVNVIAKEQLAESHSQEKTTTSGIFGKSLTSFTVGTKEEREKSGNKSKINVESQIGSVEGNILIQAGNKYNETGGNQIIAAKGNVDIFAEKILQTNGYDVFESYRQNDVTIKGINTAGKNILLNSGQSVKSTFDNSQKTTDPRFQALAALTTTMQVGNLIKTLGVDPKNATTIKVTQTYGESSSSSSQELKSKQVKESKILAGGNVNLHAWGAGKDSNIEMTGSRVQAGNIVKLKAEGDILAKAAQSTVDNISKSDSFSWDIGIGGVIGLEQNGLTLEGSLSGNNAKSEKNQIIQNNSHIIGNKKVIIESGGDTNLKGAVVKGAQVTGEVNGNLYIKSLQDINNIKANNQDYSATVSICIPPFCAGTSSGGFSVGDTRIESQYKSVIEQSGIQAGDGGFQLKVKGHTQLYGGVITSSKKAEDEKLNELDTGTFNYQDISNEAWYKAQQISGGVDVGNTSGVSVAPPVPLKTSDKVSNVTKSTVSKGNIIIRDEAGQKSLTGETSQETISSVNRESEKAHKPLEVIFDEEKIRAEFEIVKGFSKEMGTFIENKMKSAKAYEKELEERLKNGESKQSPEVKDLINKIEDLNKWAPGGIYRQVSTALTAALSGNVGGANNILIQSFAANYLQSLGAEQIKEIAKHIGGEGSPGHIALHALLGCAAGSVTNTCTEAAMGAAAGVVVNSLLDDPAELDPIQREQRKNLVTSIVAAIATGVGSDHVAAITNSTQIESENNFYNFVIRGGQVLVMTAGRMLTLHAMNEVAEDLLSVSEGNRSFEDLAKEYGEDFVVNYITDKSTKGAFKIIKKTKIGHKLENKYEEIAEKGKEWLLKKGYKPEYIKLKEKQYTDINALATGDTSVEKLIQENGVEYVINDLSKIRREKGIDLIKAPGGKWVVKVTDPETKYYTLVTPKPSVGKVYQNIEESKYLKEIIEGKLTWQELVDKKGIDYAEKLVKSKQSQDYWVNEIVNPNLKIKGDKEKEILKKWDEGKDYLLAIDPKLKDKSSVLGENTPYSSRKILEELQEKHGKDNVTSTTVPPLNKPNVKMAGKAQVVKIEVEKEVWSPKDNKFVIEKVQEDIRIVFDKKGYPIFDDVAKYETRIPIEDFRKAGYKKQMQMATKDLGDKIKSGEISKNQFTKEQIEDIISGKFKINGYTWHHHQDTGRMQLIPEDIHKKVKHVGDKAMSEGR